MKFDYGWDSDEDVPWNYVGRAYAPIVDETHFFQKGQLMETTNGLKSKIRVTFNRPWTWSEREEFRNVMETHNSQNVEQFFSEGFTQSGSVLTIGADSDTSRDLYEMVADYVEHYLVNVHPVAVLTVYPKETM